MDLPNNLSSIKLNNFIVKNRGKVKQTKVRMVHKMTREIKKYKNTKGGSEELKNKKLKKANRLTKEIKIMKKLKKDKITKFALEFDKKPESVLHDMKAQLKLKVLVKISCNEIMKKCIDEFRKEYPNWKIEIPKILRNIELKKKGIKLNDDVEKGELEKNERSSSQEENEDIKSRKKIKVDKINKDKGEIEKTKINEQNEKKNRKVDYLDKSKGQVFKKNVKKTDSRNEWKIEEDFDPKSINEEKTNNDKTNEKKTKSNKINEKKTKTNTINENKIKTLNHKIKIQNDSIDSDNSHDDNNILVNKLSKALNQISRDNESEEELTDTDISDTKSSNVLKKVNPNKNTDESSSDTESDKEEEEVLTDADMLVEKSSSVLKKVAPNKNIDESSSGTESDMEKEALTDADADILVNKLSNALKKIAPNKNTDGSSSDTSYDDEFDRNEKESDRPVGDKTLEQKLFRENTKEKINRTDVQNNINRNDKQKKNNSINKKTKAEETVVDSFFVTKDNRDYLSIVKPNIVTDDDISERPNEMNFDRRKPNSNYGNNSPKEIYRKGKKIVINQNKFSNYDRGYQNDKFNNSSKQFNSSDRRSDKFINNSNKFNRFDRNNDKFNHSNNRNNSDRINSSYGKFGQSSNSKFNETSKTNEKLHPSWEAKKRHQPAITHFKGKKIKFE